MEDNNNLILVNAMLDNYEEPLDISLIENNSFLQENHMNTATGN